jgi:hypothetical protein
MLHSSTFLMSSRAIYGNAKVVDCIDALDDMLLMENEGSLRGTMKEAHENSSTSTAMGRRKCNIRDYLLSCGFLCRAYSSKTICYCAAYCKDQLWE